MLEIILQCPVFMGRANAILYRPAPWGYAIKGISWEFSWAKHLFSINMYLKVVTLSGVWIFHFLLRQTMSSCVSMANKSLLTKQHTQTNSWEDELQSTKLTQLIEERTLLKLIIDGGRCMTEWLNYLSKLLKFTLHLAVVLHDKVNSPGILSYFTLLPRCPVI